MANIIELHVLKPFGVNSANRGENGETKSCVIGGASRARFSSQSVKVPVREAFNDAYHTRHLVDAILVPRFVKEYPNTTEEEIESMTLCFKLLTGSLKGEPKQIIAYSFAEAEEIYRYAVELFNSDDGKAFIESIGNKKKVKDYEKKEKEIVDEIQQCIKDVALGLDVSIFGRMSTDGPTYTIPSAMHVNHAYSIDENQAEEDFFTAFDNLFNQSAHLNASSFAANVMYFYSNIDPVQVFNNLMLPVDRKKLEKEDYTKECEKNKKFAVEGVVRTAEMLLQTVPNGKQNSMASYPMPSLVYVAVDKHTYPCTFDACFNRVINFYGNKSILATGAEKMMKYAVGTADVHEFRCFLVDSILDEEISEDIIKSVKDEGIVYDSIKNRARIFEEIRKCSEEMIDLNISERLDGYAE